MPSNKDYVVRPKWNVEMETSRVSDREKGKKLFCNVIPKPAEVAYYGNLRSLSFRCCLFIGIITLFPSMSPAKISSCLKAFFEKS